MAFQLVRASDVEIAVWQTEHGHIYVFRVLPDGRGLEPVTARSAPDAVETVERFAAEALRFATGEAEARDLIAPGSGRR